MKTNFLGLWDGIKQLFLTPKETPDYESVSNLEVVSIAKESFLQFSYDWNYMDVDHEGVLIVGQGTDSTTTGAWVDSFHQGKQVMFLEGRVDQAEKVYLRGSYPAPPGPDWGWRIEIEQGEEGELAISMFNIWPDGREEIAVRTSYYQAGS